MSPFYISVEVFGCGYECATALVEVEDNFPQCGLWESVRVISLSSKFP